MDRSSAVTAQGQDGTALADRVHNCTHVQQAASGCPSRQGIAYYLGVLCNSKRDAYSSLTLPGYASGSTRTRACMST